MIRRMLANRQLKKFAYGHMREMGVLSGQHGMDDVPYIESIAPTLATIGQVRYGPPKSTLQVIQTERGKTMGLFKNAQLELARLKGILSVPAAWESRPSVRYAIGILATTSCVGLTLEILVGSLEWMEWGLIGSSATLVAVLGSMQPNGLDRFRQWHRHLRADRAVKRTERKLRNLDKWENREFRRQQLIHDYVAKYAPLVKFIFADARERGRAQAKLAQQPMDHEITTGSTEPAGFQEPHPTQRDEQKKSSTEFNLTVR